MYNLNGMVALVIGAASKPGFGHAIAVRLAKEGADVLVFSRTLAERANLTQRTSEAAEENFGLS